MPERLDTSAMRGRGISSVHTAGRHLLAGLLVLMLGWLTPALAQTQDHVQGIADPAAQQPPAPRIGVITMTPGEDYWARFGHNAILVEDAASGERISYNYGYFDFEQPGFMRRFMRGQMLYQLVALPLEVDLHTYAAEGRGATLQWLDLPAAQAIALADFLKLNALPENADYRYDYFTDNCSTRVRDALDRALDGALARQLRTRSHGLTYRNEALRLGAGLPWMLLGMHAGLGPFADRPLSLWDEAFVPQRLADALQSVELEDGRPLVREQLELLPDRLALERDTAPSLRAHFAIAGGGLALLLGLLLRPRAGRAARLAGTALAAGIWLACGLGGLVLVGLWTLTAHVAAWGNENLLLFNPLCLALLAAIPSLARGRQPPRWLVATAQLVVAAAALALFLRFLPFRIQNNADFIVLLGPIHAVLAWRLTRRDDTHAGNE
ncbi:DUF4105 domain-containing protein [Denitratimonas sp. CY0512]|uniref:lipoprotein N-acyltransferase Lnb domain-containing protein n=1 Tax=Denitratimonas sp. CY0512 TaxID=3131940 RepID=UPI0030B41139